MNIPEHRTDDAMIFDAGDVDFPFGLPIPINSPIYSDLISPAIPISNRPGDRVLPAR